MRNFWNFLINLKNMINVVSSFAKDAPNSFEKKEGTSCYSLNGHVALKHLRSKCDVSIVMTNNLSRPYPIEKNALKYLLLVLNC